MSKDLEKMLSPFRKREDESQLATVIDSPEAIRVLAAWPATRRVWKKKKGKKPAGDQLWIWIWEGVEFDPESLARTARLSSDQAFAMLRVLVASRVVYPDGSISTHAKALVGRYVAKRLDRESPKPKPPMRDAGHKEGPRVRACPTCNASAGERCKMPNGTHYTKPFHHRSRKGNT